MFMSHTVSRVVLIIFLYIQPGKQNPVCIVYTISINSSQGVRFTLDPIIAHINCKCHFAIFGLKVALKRYKQ